MICSSGTDFFRNMLTDEARGNERVVSPPFPRLVSEEQGTSLICEASLEEVRQVIFGMAMHSVAGPDGFNAVFYQRCWDIIKHDVLDTVQDFLRGTLLPVSFIATSIAQIPKVNNPTQWSEFCPISLFNNSNKILMKLLNERLKGFLPRMVSSNQSGFIPDHQMVDNILLAGNHSFSAD
ncbi:UNVERIFIED_CONTAM: hypothetical protein Slati_0949300 [Sesamum latifolium]|uniref:Reverse transcriptase domain-containing protein n=1 Tax=Sesamum latifolium TaxID=2727402 RepID=A0AAW2XUU4_9LAMI